MVVYEARESIARDLHDLVIQRLLATGMLLQGACCGPAVGAATAYHAVGDLDATIRAIGTAIFELHADPERTSPKSELVALSHEYASTLGFAPTMSFTVPLDTGVVGTEAARPAEHAVGVEVLGDP